MVPMNIIRNHHFYGDFEIHITIDETSNEEVNRLLQWGSLRGIKCTHILLNEGSNCSQPMLTYNDKSTNIVIVLDKAHELSELMKEEGFIVSRIKIEAAPWNLEVPNTDGEAIHLYDKFHFEHHIKVLLDVNQIDIVDKIARKHGARLSRNNFKPEMRPDGKCERFVNQRCYYCGRGTALINLHDLMIEMERSGIGVSHGNLIRFEQEYVVYDTNLDLDKGWL